MLAKYWYDRSIDENKLIGERPLATLALNKDTREKIRLRTRWYSKSKGREYRFPI